VIVKRPIGEAPPAKAPSEQKIALEADTPALSLDTRISAETFDPYNTGRFDRGASWDRISKHKSR
jgi:hypothetical protein